MNQKRKKSMIALGVYGALCFLLGVLLTHGIMHRKMEKLSAGAVVAVPEVTEQIETVEDEVEPVADPVEEIIYYQRQKISYSTWFADLNEQHLEAATSRGLKNMPQTRSSVDAKALGLVEVTGNEGYTVEDLTYSIPYLTKGGKKELDAIGEAFCDSLKRKGFPAHKLIVTSVLRTAEDVSRLQRSGNVNSTSTSAHSFGTTFDISYSRFERQDPEGNWNMQPYELKKILSEVLRDQKQQERCYIKYERKQCCFHITSRL